MFVDYYKILAKQRTATLTIADSRNICLLSPPLQCLNKHRSWHPISWESVHWCYLLTIISSSLFFWLCSLDPWKLDCSRSAAHKDCSDKDSCCGFFSTDAGLSMLAARHKMKIYYNITSRVAKSWNISSKLWKISRNLGNLLGFL